MSADGRIFRGLILIPGLLALGVVPGRADEARIPIFGPDVISQPGYYLVTRDFCFGGAAAPPCVTANQGILVNSDDVTIDLNGHTLTEVGGVHGIRVASPATRGLTIKNGRLVGNPAGTPGENGIHTDAGIEVQIRVLDVEIRDFVGHCINLSAAESLDVEHCHLQGCQDGIQVIGASAPYHGRMVDNFISSMSGHGMFLRGLGGGLILHNVIRSFGIVNTSSAGILIQGLAVSPTDSGANLIQENVISSGLGAAANAKGIWIDSGVGPNVHNAIVGNIVRENGTVGILVNSDDNRIERNIVSRNGAQGISIGSGSSGARILIDGNQIESNSACGLSFVNTLSHIYRNNVIRANGGGLDVCGFAAPVTNGGGNICTAACP